MVSKTEQIECEEVVVKVPKAIMQFLREHEDMLGETSEDYLQRDIVCSVSADLDSGDVFVPEALELAKKYKLQPIFKKFDVEIPDC